LKIKLLDFRSVVARMLGLDSATLAVADYEIIARIERIITAFNNSSVVLPVQVNQVRIPTPPITHTTTHYATYNSANAAETLSSSSSSNLITNFESSSSSSPTRRHHHHSHSHHHHAHSRERSVSPSRGHHHHHHHHHGNEASAQSRARSKSPRKQVTIDPNSY
jgi:hypothetical protein